MPSQIIDQGNEPDLTSWLAQPRKLRVLDLFSGYTIREDGEVTSRFGRTITPQVGKAGYVRVELACTKYLLHRLVAGAFVANPDGKPHVNHIDGDKANNFAANLEWVTQSENQIHAYRTGLQRGFKKSTPLSDEHRSALCGSRWKGERRDYHADGLAFDCPAKAAAHFGVSRQTFYNRAASPKHPDWRIEVRKEVEG
jgi:hypothetical protein